MLRKLELKLGNILGYFILMMRFKLSIVRNNLLNTNLFTDSEVKKLIKANYIHYGNLLVEFIHLIIAPKHFARTYIRGHNFEELFKVVDRGQGVFLLVGHIGNWEACVWYAIHQGLILNVITKHIKNRFLEFVWSKNRINRGISLIYDDISSGGFKVIRSLKKGELISYILDQHTYPPHGIKTDFFGTNAWTLSGLAKYVQKLGTPVVPISCYRDEFGYFDITIEKELSFKTSEDKDLEIKENTFIYTKIIEEMITRHPEQWIWLHRRWKNITI